MKKKFKKVLASAMAGIMALSVMMSPGLGTKVAKAAEEAPVYTSKMTIYEGNNGINILNSASGVKNIQYDDTYGYEITVDEVPEWGATVLGVCFEVDNAKGKITKDMLTVKAKYQKDDANQQKALTKVESVDAGENLKLYFSPEEGNIEDWFDNNSKILIEVTVKGLATDPNDPSTEFSITVGEDAHGYAVATKKKATKGTEIKLIPTADDGYGLKDWEVVTVPEGENEAPKKINVSEENKFTMPASNVKVTPIFAKEYAIKVTDDGNGTGKADVNYQIADRKVTLSTDAKGGYAFKEWQVVKPAGLKIENNSFTMPAGDVEVNAVFEELKAWNAHVNYASAGDWWPSYGGGEDGDVLISKDGTYKVYYNLKSEKGEGGQAGFEYLCVDIEGLAGSCGVGTKGLDIKAEGNAATQAAKQKIVNDKGITVTGLKLYIDEVLYKEFKAGEYYYGDLNGENNLRIEICNHSEWGAAFDRSLYADVAATSQIAMEFTITGLDNLKPSYKVNLSSELDGDASASTAGLGNVTVTPENAEEGQDVTLAVVPFSGYKFKEWKTTDVTITDNKFKMPAKDISIVAVFEKIPEAAEPEKPADDKEVITETKFGPENITASNNFVVSSKDYPVNPVKADLTLSFNKAFWNDWCQAFVKVDYDGNTKYYVLAGNQAKWNTTVGFTDKTGDVGYVVPVSGETGKTEIVVDKYDIILMDSVSVENPKLDYELKIKEIAGCKDWKITFYCPAWSVEKTGTFEDPDGTTKDLMKEEKDVYGEDGKVIKNEDGTNKKEPVITSKDDAYVYRASGIVYTSSKVVDKAPEPAKKGTALTVGAGKYKVTSADAKNPAVAFTAPKSKTATSVTIPATIKDANGVTYKVTSVAANAFAKNAKVKKVVIGKNVKTIGVGAFSGCTKLATVTFKGTAVTSIGKNAFKGDKALKSIVITKKVKTIGASAFEGCTKLAKVTMKSTKLATVGNKAFAKCTALKSLTFPATCKKLGASVFTGDKKLKTLTLKSTKITTKTLNKNTFKGTVKTIKVKVPSKKVAAYKKLFATKGLNKKAKVTK